MVFDPTTKILDATISDELRTLVNAQISAHPTKEHDLENRSYVGIYEKLLRHISANPDAANVSDLVRIQNPDGTYDVDYTRTWLFIKQTVDINNPQNSTASDAIRDFTFNAYETYFGEPYGGQGSESAGDDWMQAISNAIADAIFKGMLGFVPDPNDPTDPVEMPIPDGLDGTTGKLSKIKEIVDQDAVTAATGFYLDENEDAQFGVWAGNAFFVGAGYDGAYLSHILHEVDHPRNEFDTDKANTYDLFTTMKAVTFLVGELDFQKVFNLFTSNVTDAQSGSLISTTTFNTFAFLKNAYGSQALTVFEEATTDDIVVKFSSSLLDYLFDDTSTINDEFTNLSNQFILGTVNSTGDNLSGTDNKEIIHGGAGNDTIIGSEGNDLIDGGYDYDVVNYQLNDDKVRVTIENINNSLANRIGTVEKIEDNIFSGVPNFDILYNIEQITGSDKNDVFRVRNAKEELTIAGVVGDDSYEFHSDFGENVRVLDNGGILLIDGEAPILDENGYLLQVGSGSDKREFKFGKIEEVTRSDGIVLTGEHLKIEEWNSNSGTAKPNTIIILDYYNYSHNWNFTVNDANIVEGDNNYNYLIGTDQYDHIIAKDGVLDFLIGLDGHDRLIGGRGQDFMDGGDGFDTYVYNEIADSFKTTTSENSYDSIVSFVQGEDKIDVTGIGFTGITTLGTGGVYDLEYEHLVSSTGALETTIINNATSFYIEMNGHVHLTNSDFIGLGLNAQDLVGDHGDNELIGSGFADTITGHGGDDVVELRGGNDIADLGEGDADKVVYKAASTNYTITSNTASRLVTVTDNVGSDGVDSLNNVEVLEFTDTTLYWDGTAWIATQPDAKPRAGNDSITTGFESAVTVDVLFNDSDAEDDILDQSNLSIDTNPANGAVAVNTDGTITYTPNSDFSGSDSFIYTLTDSAGGTDTATVFVSVGAAPANVVPVASDDTVAVAYETETILAVLDNDTDDKPLDGSHITIGANPANGAVVVNTDGTITYTPNAAYDGVDSFNYTITDASGASDTATVNITVSPEPSNYAPDAHNDTALVDRDSSVDITVLGNDTDTEDSSFTGSNLSIDTTPEHGSVSIGSTGVITFTPNQGYVGSDSFTYTLTDSGGETDTATVDVTVQAAVNVNDPATHTGDANNNNITSGSANDTLLGLDGNDTLYGVAGNDQLVGGAGDDTLKGYKGNDTYIWSSGDGNDLIQESNTSGSGTDILHFAGGITLSDLKIEGYTSHDLRIEYIPTGEVITIQNQLYHDKDYRVETLTFDDGSSYNLEQGFLVQGNTANEYLYGSIFDDTMHGGQGNDTLAGGNGNETLYGDLGDDVIYGAKGDDSYFWKSGDGNDTFIEQNYTGSGTDTIFLTGGITRADVKIYGYTSHDMRIEHLPTGEIITLENNQYSDTDYQIETIQFDDGSSYNLQQGALWLGGVGNQHLEGSIFDDTMRGGKDNDTLQGAAGNDILYGDLGDDTVYGGKGDDTYIWEAGRGNDTFIEQNYTGSGTDTVYLKGGITLSDLHIYGYTSHDLRVEYRPTGEILTMQNLHYSDTDYHIEFLRFDDGTTYNLQTGVQWLGGVGNQRLDGSIYDDSMFGGKDNDTLAGVAGNDTLSGDLGNDVIYGGKGDDTYLWKAGDGNDIFIEQNYTGSGTDTIFLTSGITQSDVKIYGYTSHDMRIEHLPTGEIITLQNNQYNDTDYQIETIQFDDGSSYNLQQGALWLGGVGNQHLEGSIYDDSMHGGQGNDTLAGAAGNDTLYGDLGDDVIYGSVGDDTYVWKSGDGNDTLIEQNYTGSGTDTIHLTGGITLSDLHIYGSTSHDLKVEYIPTGETLTLQNEYYNDLDYHIESLRFDDGSTFNLSQGVTWLGGVGNQRLDGSTYDDTMHGGQGNDTLYGDLGNDTLYGDLGNDRLYGGRGDDSYVWQSGDGNDWIYEQNYTGSGDDTLHLTGGIVAADVTFSRTGNDLLVTYTPTGEAIRIDNQYVSDPDYKVETLLFDNGTTVDLLGV